MIRASLRLLPLALLVAAAAGLCRALAPTPAPRIALHRTRSNASDLELGGNLAGVPAGQTRFVAFADLLQLPLETDTITGDSNFAGTVRITGISLEKLPALLGAQPGAEMITALCDDRYAAHYPAAYLHAHHPLLVLRIDGHDPSQWPLSSDHSAMGPYLISHARFTPAFHILAHQDEPQIPWGVVRLDFNRESAVYAPIQPQGPTALSLQVQQGYAIAAQNCFRCHDRNGQGGRKAGRTWQSIARVSVSQPAYFDAYVLNPSQLEPSSQMAGSPQYDAATLAALRAYFRPFAETHP